MVPKVKTKNLKKRPPIARDTEKAISEYYQSKKEEQTTIKHYPEWDIIKGEPIIELMQVRRELLAADIDLNAKRSEYQSRRLEADQQWQDLREKQKLLRKSFLKFDDFVKENREKRDRAERKIRDEKERQKIREAEIAELEKNLDYIEKVRDKMQSHVEKYKPFQRYLETVLDTKEFQSIAEIFNRYETLLDARASLVEYQDENLHTLEETSMQLQKMTEEKSQNLMDLNSRLAQLQSRHARARAKALQWEAVVARVKDIATRKELEESQVRACIWNLYLQICRRKGVPAEATREDLEKQLFHIKRTVGNLAKIVKSTKRKAKEAREKQAKSVKEIDIQEKKNTGHAEVRREETKTSFKSFSTVVTARKN